MSDVPQVEFGERLSESTIFPPPSVELYEIGLGKPNHLPTDLSENPQVIEQSVARRNLNDLLRSIFARCPNPNIEIADTFKNKEITEDELSDVYERLSQFIEDDANNARILLYIPSQLLPGFDEYEDLGQSLTDAIVRLRSVYKEAWMQLLYEREYRASFVDGDILEPGMDEPEQIIKAGHLIPDLLAHNIITFVDISGVISATQDELLLSSIAEGCLVALDRHLISKDDLIALDAFPQFTSKFDAAQGRSKSREHQKKATLEDLAFIDAQYEPDSPYRATMSEKRAKWENKVRRNSVIDELAHNTCQDIEAGAILLEQLDPTNPIHVRALFLFGERQAMVDVHKAQGIVGQAQSIIDHAWNSSDQEMKNAVINGLAHWHHLGINVQQFLDQYNIALPDLSLPLPVDLDGRDREAVLPLLKAADVISSDSELSQSFYPFLIAFGSRLKGYADHDADIDAAIVVRPNVSYDQREALIRSLKERVPELEHVEQLLEFWTEEKQDGIGFRAVPEGVRDVVGAMQVHFLLGGAWTGHENEMKILYQDVVLRYVNLDRFGDQKDDVRRHLLRQLELDILQVRLMHKGYRKYYPSWKEAGTEHSSAIDWDSDFWDPGYRRVATQLFLSRVFLPEVQEKQ